MLWALVHGKLAEAFHYNPLLFCLLPLIVGIIALYLFNKDIRPQMGILYSDRALLFYLVFLILWGIGRNIGGI